MTTVWGTIERTKLGCINTQALKQRCMSSVGSKNFNILSAKGYLFYLSISFSCFHSEDGATIH